MYPIDYDEPQFLEPAHSHDPIQISHIVPTPLNDNIPTSFQDALIVLQESTSVAFASSRRLQTLAGERFHRLVPARAELSFTPADEIGGIKYSEPAFFTYQNQTRAEKRYLLEEALPDWRHKAARAFHEHCQCGARAIFHDTIGSQIEFETWWTQLQEEFGRWLEAAEDTEIPGFEETVAGYRVFHAKEMEKGLTREERCSRKFLLELDVPEPKRDRAATTDSGIGMTYNSEAEQYGFTSGVEKSVERSKKISTGTHGGA